MSAPLVDLFSDTATQPTEGMLRAMCNAPLGDEQRRTDPTVAQLEERAADLLGLHCALFVPTATMANQIAIALHCRPGDEVLCHRTAHVRNYEGGGNAANSGAQTYPLEGEHGIFSAEAVLAALRVDDPHQPESRLVVVENTSNGGGGSIWPDEEFSAVVRACRRHGLALHVDGARLMNAAVARGLTPSHWSSHADSVQVCFSKGLGCPMGAILGLGTAAEGRRARRIKQRLGGALRQAGVIAGAMLYALDHNVERLAEDHARATKLAQTLAELPVELPPVETNLVYFRPTGVAARDVAEQLRRRGILVSEMSGGFLRACTHLGIDDEGLDRACSALRELLAS